MDWLSLIIAGCFEIIGIVMKLINYQKQKNYQQGLKQMWIMIMKKMI